MSDSEIDEETLTLLAQEEGERDAREILNTKKNNQNKNKNKGGSNNGKDTLNDIKFCVEVNNKCETLQKRFSGDNYVRDVGLAIADELTGNEDSVGNSFGARKKMIICFYGKVLNMDIKLSSVEGIKGDGDINLPLIVSFKVIGGAQESYDEKKEFENNNNSKKERKRLADFKNEKRIKPTLKPDCIYGWDDKKQLRVKMPCGHVFAPDTLFKLTKSLVEILIIYNPKKKKKKKWFDVLFCFIFVLFFVLFCIFY